MPLFKTKKKGVLKEVVVPVDQRGILLKLSANSSKRKSGEKHRKKYPARIKKGSFVTVIKLQQLYTHTPLLDSDSSRVKHMKHT